MKILYVHQYFNTPADGGSLRSYYLAKELVKKGCKVVVITAHNNPIRVKSVIEGIEVTYLPVGYDNQMSFSQRGKAFLKFMTLAILESVKQRDINLCYVMTSPLSTGAVALFNKLLLQRPYIFEVGDIWPEVPIEMGLIKTNWKRNVLRLLERIFYKHACGLVGLSEPITSHLERLAPDVPRQTIFNISDCETFKYMPKQRAYTQQYGLEDKFVISYTGTFGLANDLCRMIDLAEAVSDLPIAFLMIGEGAEKRKFESELEESDLTNIHVYGAMPKQEIHHVVNISDAMLVSFADFPSLHTGSPNKFFDALAAGKLIVSNFDGWIGELIQKENCGIVITSPIDFRNKIEPFINDSAKLSIYQAKAKELAEQRFSLEIQSKKQFDFIQQVIN